jgi:hypothetical protein
MKRVLARQVGRALTKSEQKMVGGTGVFTDSYTMWESQYDTQTSFNGGPDGDCDSGTDLLPD